MSSWFAATLFSGVGMGFAVAAPIGPMALLCIHRTLTSGVAIGLATGLGAATVHLAYSALAVVGTAAIAQSWINAHPAALVTISAVVLIWLAIRMLRAKIVIGDGFSYSPVRLGQAYLSAVVVGMTNPMTLVLFFAAVQAFQSQSSSTTLAAGVFIGSLAWWIILSVSIAVARARLDQRLLLLGGRLTSLTLIAVAACMLLHAAGNLERWF